MPPYSTGHAGAIQPFLARMRCQDRKSSLVKLFALILLAAQVLRVIFGDEAADFLLEGKVFWAELDTHVFSPVKSRMAELLIRLARRRFPATDQLICLNFNPP